MATWILPLSIVLLLAVSSPVVGTGIHNCTWGPSYWCQSLANAETCAVVEYCVEHVWNHTAPAGLSGNSSTATATATAVRLAEAEKIKPSPGLCILCNFTLELIKPYIDSNATEQEVSHVLEKLCSLLGPYNTTCEGEIVEFLFPALWVVLQLEVDYGVACATLHCCNASNVTTEQRVSADEARNLVAAYGKPSGDTAVGSVGPVSEGPFCSICLEVFKTLKSYIDSNTTEPDLQKKLDGICKFLPPPYNNTCDQSVKEYLPLFFSILKKQEDAGMVCQDLGLCNASARLPRLSAPPSKATPALLSPAQTPKLPLEKFSKEKDDPILCEACELVSTFLEIYIVTNSSEAKVEETVQKLCNYLPSNATCLPFVDEYFPLVWSLAQRSLDGKGKLCELIGVCQQN